MHLSLLWFQQLLGGSSLPLAVGSFRAYARGPLTGPVRAVARCHVRDKNRIVADVVFSTGGNVVAELSGVDILRRPDEAGAPAPRETVHAEA